MPSPPVPARRARPFRVRVVLLAALLGAPLGALTGCGTLPQPFLGNPGAAGRVLGQPPAPRLAIPSPRAALLPAAAGARFAADLARGLRAQTVPAFALRPAATDWRLRVTAAALHGQVVPRFTLLAPSGQPSGGIAAAPVPAAAWTAGDPALLESTAASVAPALARLLARVEVAILRANPHSLLNRPARVRVAPVTGAPGNGDRVLAAAMRHALAALHEDVLGRTGKADFLIQGAVRLSPLPDGRQMVQLRWIVTNAAGREGGRVFQLNRIQAGALDHDWSKVAPGIARQGATGIAEVIRRQSRRDPDAPG
ncbi:MAG: hypothetical protein ACP5NP_11980 [Acetobacteraceae bacterium]